MLTTFTTRCQTTVSLSDPLDMLTLTKTKIKKTKTILGEPDTTSEYNALGNIGGGCIDLSMTTLKYNKLGTTLIYGGYYNRPHKRKVTQIFLFDNSPISLNDSIKLNKSTKTDITDSFGNPPVTDTVDTKVVYKYKFDRGLSVDFHFDTNDNLSEVLIWHNFLWKVF